MPMSLRDLHWRALPLAEAHRPRLVAHLCRLPGEQRYTRFQCKMSDEAIAAYVARIDFGSDRLLGLPDPGGDFQSVVQASPQSPGRWELAFTTAPDFQRRGIATMLGRMSIDPLVAGGAAEAFIHCAADNVAMRAVAAKLGFNLHVKGADVLAHRRF
jgi:RimJ/RimL family protein N-acetyltransferase